MSRSCSISSHFSQPCVTRSEKRSGVPHHAQLEHAHALARAQRGAAVVRVVQVLQHHHQPRQPRRGHAVELVAPLVAEKRGQRGDHVLRVRLHRVVQYTRDDAQASF